VRREREGREREEEEEGGDSWVPKLMIRDGKWVNAWVYIPASLIVGLLGKKSICPEFHPSDED
jgi:hypothetical protein